MTPHLRGFHASTLAVSDKRAVPDMVQLLPPGEFSGRDGRGPFRADTPAILQAFTKWGMPLAIDYEHQSLFSKDNGAPAPAAGWVERLIANSNGLWGKVDWTESARQKIAQGEYRYLSPVFDYQPGGSIFRIISAGLTNSPNLFLTAFNSRLPLDRAQDRDMNPLVRDAMQRAAPGSGPAVAASAGSTNPLLFDAISRARRV